MVKDFLSGLFVGIGERGTNKISVGDEHAHRHFVLLQRVADLLLLFRRFSLHAVMFEGRETHFVAEVDLVDHIFTA